ncbi:FRG domain protein [Clostridium ragsdalei P11]|uniref:FRG domain protein n=1 Tax=Clostridium ragsdalei P11 TaxID=1353534 RepID=A0A1A6AJ02_9CLOT|nr:FRG domain-containing protein [Clostridium ragsdalei]OBR90029.1 FRG domain protein [Clostridium ragsdalei P11]
MEKIQDIRKFLKDNKNIIFNRKIINPKSQNKYLNGHSVELLVELMKEKKVEKLICSSGWYLKDNYDYYNSYAKKVYKTGNAKDLDRKGYVFVGQNTFLNPFYENYSGTTSTKDRANEEIAVTLENDASVNIGDLIDIKEIENIDYISTLDMYVKRINSLQDDNCNRIVWYRGQSNIKYELIPSIYRKDKQTKKYLLDYKTEKDYLSFFKAQSFPFLKNIPQSDWEWLILMQHYGLQTRLLDFTIDPLIALSFALRTDMPDDEYNCSNNAVVWIFDPYNYNKESINQDASIVNLVTLDDQQTLLYGVGDKPSRISEPLACIGTLNNSRIVSQKGTFLLFPRLPIERVRPFEKICDDKAILQKLIIPSSKIENMRRQLKNMGYNNTKLFPGLDSLAKDILYNYRKTKLIENELL